MKIAKYALIGLLVLVALLIAPLFLFYKFGHTETPPLYGHQLLKYEELPPNNQDKDGSFVVKVVVNPDSIKKHGISTTINTLADYYCTKPCQITLYDDPDVDSLWNSASYELKSTKAWKRQNYVHIADHIVALKDFHSTEIVEYPLTYDKDYQTWSNRHRHK